MTNEKEISKKFFKLIHKYLKNEVEDIGYAIYKYLLPLVITNYENITELSIRSLTEILIYINENLKRIVEIWTININNDNQDKNLIKNSIELLDYYSNIFLYSFFNFKKYINLHNFQDDYLIEARAQKNSRRSMECN